MLAAMCRMYRGRGQTMLFLFDRRLTLPRELSLGIEWNDDSVLTSLLTIPFERLSMSLGLRSVDLEVDLRQDVSKIIEV